MKNGRLKANGVASADHKAEGFPIEIKAGGSVIRILYNPLVVKQPSETTSEKNGRKVEVPETKTYPSFLVEYYEGSRLVRQRRNSLAKAKAVANDIKVRILNQDVEVMSLLIEGRERRIYLAALERLQGFGKEIDDVAKEYADATRALAPLNLDLATVVQQALGVSRRLGRRKTTSFPLQEMPTFWNQ